MLIKLETLRERLHAVIINKGEQGFIIEDLAEELDTIENSYDSFVNFIKKLADIKNRPDWPYIEPNKLEEIWEESDPNRPIKSIGNISVDESAKRVESAFLGSICGCILGKPLEQKFTGKEIKAALIDVGEWPLEKYVSKNIKEYLPRVHRSFPETAREYINYVAPDDDINYTIMGMLILEKYGINFTHKNVKDLWIHHLPIGTTFGPERTTLIKSGLESLDEIHRTYFSGEGGIGDRITIENEESEDFIKIINDVLNPGDELCGAAIRADAYGYASPGNPAQASELAWRDASFTHNRTGIYGTMFIAAAIASAQVLDDRMEIIRTALKFVPQKSRFYERALASLKIIEEVNNWEEGYRKINDKFGIYGHCKIYQEIGMLINTLKFAKNVGHGICVQVSQGADTDSFGATSGSLLGAYFGPGYLEDRWLKPFNDDIHTGLAWFFERSISKLAKRMSELPMKINN
tara:strand:- start:28566 stop:29957 length:1392 start_codon:yes stop_codon:yes gene_type:complete